MGIKVRFGTKDDIDALVEVECSDVETWYHYSSEGRGDPAPYDELSSMERVMHGGPWMDRTALTKYWKTIEQLEIIPLIAEIDGRVVGHLDVTFSDELPLGHFLYLDVLMVHKAFRRRGAATALIKTAETLAKKKKVGFMLVQPQQYEGPSGLTYRSCNFEKAFDIYRLETPIDGQKVPSRVQITSIPQNQKAPLKTHTMMCGWDNISKKTWDFGVNPDIELLHAFSQSMLTLSASKNKSRYFFHVCQKLFEGAKGSLSLWSPTPPNQEELQDIFQAAKASASWLGIKTLTTKTVERYVATLQKLGFAIKSKAEPYLIKNFTKKSINSDD